MGETVKYIYIISFYIFDKSQKRKSSQRVTTFRGNALKNEVLEWRALRSMRARATNS
jgi:hypothetical protein